MCFSGCVYLRGVIFGASFPLKYVLFAVFSETCIESISIPESVAKLGSECGSIQSIILDAFAKLESPALMPSVR